MKIQYSCIVDTTYTLSLYLLCMTMEEIRATRFFVGSAIPAGVMNQLPNVIGFDDSNINVSGSVLKCIGVRMKLLFYHLIYVLPTRVFGQDHISLFEMLLGLKKYTLLEDAPGIFRNCLKGRLSCPRNTTMSLLGHIKHWLRYGTLTGRTMGTNGQCINRIVTDKDDVSSPVVAGRKCELVNLRDLWDSSSTEKQDFIKRVFGMSDEMLDAVTKCKTLFLTQPFREDHGLTDEEWRTILDPIIGDGKDGVAIKIHPRDKFDYAKHYPDVPILNCHAPMQLICFMGLSFTKAITISSTAISAFPDSVEKVVLGLGVNPKLKASLR